MNARVFLSRRNLLTLLSKLDRRIAGQQTACTIIKNDKTHPVYPQTMRSIEVVAVEDEDYYFERTPGPVHDSDTPNRELAQAILKLKGREYLNEKEFSIVNEFLSKYDLC
ncbi:hypothetical protein KOM00_00030 [Geomonas sp. Red69]|uniref:hypothetical protein n=1 Tax=Geomonas diazotrophica TaxID=2843197 RepID=UPI001C119C86|nr:hypothetical protein [Geomonas diazotrophica]MBU5635117.1 hypothetical protein [Geomonas diazotrophica]